MSVHKSQTMATDDVFSKLADDMLIKIIFKLKLKDWGRLACVSKKLCSVIHDSCYKTKCTQKNPILVSDLLSDAVSTSPPGGWAVLFKILVCCPGLAHVGLRCEVIPENVVDDDGGAAAAADDDDYSRLVESHLTWWDSKLSREQGNELLDERFSRNCLYITEWPGCLHFGEKPNYMLFRGIFKNFKTTMVWKTLNEGGDKCKVDLSCAFCSCKHTWDLYSASCFKNLFGFHDDGEPVYRAFVCENGHVSGAWTDWTDWPDVGMDI